MSAQNFKTKLNPGIEHERGELYSSRAGGDERAETSAQRTMLLKRDPLRIPARCRRAVVSLHQSTPTVFFLSIWRFCLVLESLDDAFNFHVLSCLSVVVMEAVVCDCGELLSG